MLYPQGSGLMQLPEDQEMEYQPNDFIVSMAKALSDPIRVRMVRLLAEGREGTGFPPVGSLRVPGAEDVDGVCVSEFQEAFRLGQSKVSYHLRILREAGLVTEESRGKWSFYRINRQALEKMINVVHNYLAI